MPTILIVEDDEHIRTMVQYILEKESYSVTAVSSAEDALAACEHNMPDLILLDIELPGMNGYEFCDQLQKQYINLPIIIMLTDLADVDDIEKGLSEIADDYIAKPFNPRLLVARIKASLRRHDSTLQSKPKNIIAYSGINVDGDSRTVIVDEECVLLQKMEFDILRLLVNSPDRVFSRDELISLSKGDNYYITDRAIDNQIYKLRKKLGNKGSLIKTVSGIGYKLSGM
ncbi:response regulator transcription factor [Thalassotalea fusca]